MGRTWVRAAGVALLLGVSGTATAQPVPSGASAPTPRSHRELAALPEVPSVELPTPSPESVEQVANILTRLLSEDEEERRAAATDVRAVHASLVSAIDRRIDAVASQADRKEMKRLLLDIRRDARNEIREQMRAEGKKGKIDTPDYFDMVVAHPRPSDENWQNLVRILALSRMLVSIGSVEATRSLIRVYVRFDFLRIDTQLQLEALGEQAVAALTETRRHDAKKVAEWAERQLDLMGKAIPSEAVQTSDRLVLCDVLRAYGRIKDPDAARIIISFANSERAQVREAARQAVALLGEVGNWQLRDAYENTVGKRPPRDWSWERTARELFGEFDRLRLAHVYDLFDQGRAAESEGKFEAMREAYDKVLARSPLFELRAEMAPGYLAYARAKADSDLEGAILALTRAERLAEPESDVRKPIQSLLMTLEGERLLKSGIVDQELFRRALELDPSNERAERSFDIAQRGEQAAQDEKQRWIGVVVIGALALIAALFILLWPRRQTRKPDHDESKPSDSDGKTKTPQSADAREPSSETDGGDARESGNGAGDAREQGESATDEGAGSAADEGSGSAADEGAGAAADEGSGSAADEGSGESEETDSH